MRELTARWKPTTKIMRLRPAEPSDRKTEEHNVSSKDTTRWSQEIFRKVDKSLHALPPIDNLRTKKWLADISNCAGSRTPLHPDWPHIELHQITKVYLRSNAHSIDVDKRLLKLIDLKTEKLVAFAACAGHLSSSAVEAGLKRLFPWNGSSPIALVPYLEAVIAASYGKPELFSDVDVSFARAISRIDKSREPSAQARTVFSALARYIPANMGFRERAKVFTGYYCKMIQHAFAAYQAFEMRTISGEGAPASSTSDVDIVSSAMSFASALPRLKKVGNDIEAVFNSHLPYWRRWLDWQPDRERLNNWAQTTRRDSQLNQLLLLEGPDLIFAASPSQTLGQGLVLRGGIRSWLQSQGFHTRSSLWTEESTDRQTSVLQHFLSCVVDVLQRSHGRLELLKLYLDRERLDNNVLNAFRSACGVWKPDFIDFLVSPGLVPERDADTIVLDALKAVSPASCKHVREPLLREIGDCVDAASVTRKELIRKYLEAGLDWTPLADRLWSFRSGLTNLYWLHSHIDGTLLKESQEQDSKRSLTALRELQEDVNIGAADIRDEPLKRATAAFVETFLWIGRTPTDQELRAPAGFRLFSDKGEANLLAVLHKVWLQTNSGDSLATREVALCIMSTRTFDANSRAQCIASLPALPTLIVYELRQTFARLKRIGRRACMELTGRIASIVECSEHISCWRALLRHVLLEYDVEINQSDFTDSGFEAYSGWISLLTTLGFGDEIALSALDSEWLSELDPLATSLMRLEILDGSNHLIHSILTARCTLPVSRHYLQVLDALDKESDSNRLQLMERLFVSFGSEEAKNELLLETIGIVRNQDADSLSAFDYLLSTLKFRPLPDPIHRGVAKTRFHLHLERTDLNVTAQRLLLNLANLMDLSLVTGYFSLASLDSTQSSLKEQVADLIAQAKRLEHFRSVLRRRNPDEAQVLSDDLGLEDVAGKASLFAELPLELLDVIEEAVDGSIEFHFPLTNVSAINRLAFGLDGTEVLFVHLQLTESGSFDTVCVHLEASDFQSYQADHESSNYISFSTRKTDGYGRSAIRSERIRGRPPRLAFNVARTFMLLQNCDDLSLELLYQKVEEYIHTGANRCMICRENVGARLHRATLCKKPECGSQFRQSNLDLQIADVRNHTRAVDLLLTAVMATTRVANNFDVLLPDRPGAGTNARDLFQALSALPALSKLASKAKIPSAFSNGIYEGSLLSWICNSYRGFFVPATEAYKIPNMPGIHQFLLVNGSPELEAGFAAHHHLQPRHVLFHGTSLDRLYPVLAQGLRILSGTPLQKFGQAHGAGIYMAREPSYAMGFATKGDYGVTQTSAFFDKDARADFHGARVLLGCEHAGDDEGGGRSGSIHVIKDPTRVMVRYVWIVPPHVKVPRVQDIRVPTLGTFSSLRASAAGR